MKKLLLLLLTSSAYANCDLSQFRGACDITIHPRPSHAAPSLVYCGNSYGYVSKKDYEVLSRYTRRSMNMVLKINDEFVDAPCLPASRF